MPAASETGGLPPGGGEDIWQDYEIRSDEGFVYKVPRGLCPDAEPSSTQPASGPDPKVTGLHRRRRALLRLRAKRLRDLSRWEAVASEPLTPLPAPQPPAPPSQPVAAAASSSASVVDGLLAQVDIQTEMLKKLRQWCEEANAICDEGEAGIVDSMVALPLRASGRNPKVLVAALSSPDAEANPKELVVELSSPDAEANPKELVAALSSLDAEANPKELTAALGSTDEEAPGNLDEQNGQQEASGVTSATIDLMVAMPTWDCNLKKLMVAMDSPDEVPLGNNLDEQNVHQEVSVVSSAVDQWIKNSVRKKTRGHGLPPPILTESSMRKRVTNLSGSKNVVPQASIEPKRKKASGSTSTAPGTPGSTKRRKAESTPARARDVVCSPGPLTRRRAAAKNESPGSQNVL